MHEMLEEAFLDAHLNINVDHGFHFVKYKMPALVYSMMISP
ncbi:hypothetical protein SPAR40_1815 [Streptococcus pneumoniae GA16531]|nr:hypothetical protein SPAR40_1815 [Streptococcus pneumoniae GA16531]